MFEQSNILWNIKLIATLEKPNSGTIQYFGERLNRQGVRDLIGYIPQDIALFEHMTVNENITVNIIT